MARMRTKWAGIGLMTKVFLICLLVPFLYTIYMGWYNLPRLRATLWQQLEAKTQEEVSVAWGTLQYWYDLEASGQVSRTDAQAAALAQVTQFRYGEQQDGYFWVNDFRPVLLAHPFRTDLVNTDVSNYRDPDGKAIFVDFASICRTDGEGFYSYRWQYKDNAGRIEPKLSYVKSFEPWGWIVGTGIYTNEVMVDYQRMQTQMWYVFAAILVCGLLLCWLIIRIVLSKPLASLVKTSEALALGDVEQKVDIKSKDEIGVLAVSYSKVVDYMNEMADVANRVASGDLAVDVKPRSDKDALGKALSQMVFQQRQLIGKVKSVAVNVAESSKQLARASEQTAQATQQITSTIQQVARGAADQSTSLQQTASSVEQLSGAIDQIAEGSQVQAKGVEEAAGIVKRVSKAIAEVTTNAKAGEQEWKSTAVSATEGARKTHETVEGMGKIKKAMDAVSLRVMDLGKRSQEIGNIVGTIDDIAAQTNLLALNAAIEAARAGEQGRGFAVVADEVRKLAERSSIATKEIAALVGGIQSEVREAVGAMQQGSKEVEVGYKLAADAGAALDDILTRSDKVGKQVDQISSAAQQLQELSGNMVEAIDRINHIIEQNAAATEEMTASSGVVSKAVEATASVAEQNSAAAEEVSASVEEMSAQVEEALAATQSLTDMADDMQKAVAVFRTEGSQTKEVIDHRLRMSKDSQAERGTLRGT
jgi:methyl-accepting chemotaxis protein